MIKRTCDLVGCNAPAMYTLVLPRDIVGYVKDSRGTKIKAVYSTKLVETDLCNAHFNALADWFKEIKEE